MQGRRQWFAGGTGGVHARPTGTLRGWALSGMQQGCATTRVGLQVPNGAAGYYLLGRIHSLTNRHDAAVQFHTSALILDPLLWAAYEELCALGASWQSSTTDSPAGECHFAHGWCLAILVLQCKLIHAVQEWPSLVLSSPSSRTTLV